MKTWLLALASLFCLPATAAPADTLAQRVQACTACHGQQGRAAPDGYHPRIAGKPALDLFNQPVNFREGRRRCRPAPPPRTAPPSRWRAASTSCAWAIA